MIKHSELSSFGLRVWRGTIDTPFPPHRHNEIELNAIEDGFLTYILAGHQVTVARGSIAVFWAAIPHQVIDYAPETHVHWGTVPLSEVLRWDLPRSFVLALLAGTLFIEAKPLYDLRFFRQWHIDLQTDRTALPLREIESLLHRFAVRAEIPRPAAPVTAGDANRSRAWQMAAYIGLNFHKPLTAATIAEVVNLHPNYAMHIFKRVFGLSLIAYLTQQRIAHAQQLLIMSDASVTEIALASGFSTLSHFYTMFRRICGISPGQYRAALRLD